MGRTLLVLGLCAGLAAAPGVRADVIEPEEFEVPEEEPPPPPPPLAPEPVAEAEEFYDTGRFYLYVESGNNFTIEEKFAPGVDLDDAGGFSLVLGGGGGYNLTDHWSIELQAHGTEANVDGLDRGTLTELSTINLIPAVRFRWPLEGGRLVPFVTGGFGYSTSDINDTSDFRTKVRMDETTFVGSVAAGVDYFITPDIAFGLGAHAFIFPDQDTTVTVRDDSNNIILDENGSVNLTSVALLARIRMFLGDPGTRDGSQEGSLFFGHRGPFDTADPRFYMYALGGHTFLFDDKFGDGVEVKAPGDFNATLGGAFGLNLTRHWGLEVQMVHTETNLKGFLEGKISEFANLTVLPGVRYRYAFCDGRLVLFGSAHLGAAFNNINDHRTTADVEVQAGKFVGEINPKLRADKTSIAGQVGIGAEYFLNRYISFGFALPYYIYPDWDTSVERFDNQYRTTSFVESDMNISGLAALIEVHAYVP